MPDISMRKNEECSKKLSCYRFAAKPSEYRQSYASFYEDGYGKCEYFIDNNKGGTDEY